VKLSVSIFVLVLLAAVMHAGWNILVKMKLDRFSAVVLLQSVLGLVGLGIMLMFGLPPAAAYPYALASTIIHTFYLIYLAKAYEAGDFSVTYPIARGTAPLFTLLGSLAFASDAFNAASLAGVLIVVSGLLVLAFGTKAKSATHQKALIYALITAALISCYTLLDGLGARASEHASGSATQYAGLAFFLFGLSIFVTGIALRGPQLILQIAPHWKSGVIGGGISAIAYWIIIWCMAHAPIAMVAALRETSVLFGLAMSSYVLRERLTPMRIAGGVLIVCGAAALRLA
jgi:drug/metabolite transporter (DMT)-like permease